MIAGIFIVLTAFTFLGGQDAKNIRFLRSYGWIVEDKAVEKCEITIPAVFDEVYENYNILQREAGLDLEPYAGMSGERYTYILKNFPYDTNEQVRANVVCVDGKPVAGDIMTVRINGFMYSLKFNEAVCFSVKK